MGLSTEGGTPIEFSEADKRVMQMVMNAHVPLFREPDEVDCMLLEMEREMRHENRMENIREMEIPEDLV